MHGSDGKAYRTSYRKHQLSRRVFLPRVVVSPRLGVCLPGWGELQSQSLLAGCHRPTSLTFACRSRLSRPPPRPPRRRRRRRRRNRVRKSPLAGPDKSLRLVGQTGPNKGSSGLCDVTTTLGKEKKTNDWTKKFALRPLWPLCLVGSPLESLYSKPLHFCRHRKLLL